MAILLVLGDEPIHLGPHVVTFCEIGGYDKYGTQSTAEVVRIDSHGAHSVKGNPMRQTKSDALAGRRTSKYDVAPRQYNRATQRLKINPPTATGAVVDEQVGVLF